MKSIFNALLTLLLVTFTSFPALGAFSMSENVAMAAEYMGDPAELGEEELLRRVEIILTGGLREPSARRVLDFASERVPELGRYRAWLESGDLDTLSQRLCTALKATADYAGEKGYTLLSRELMCDWLSSRHDCGEVLPEIEQLIEVQEADVKRNPSRDNRALLAQMRLTRLKTKANIDGTADPLSYPEIWAIEREVLDIYPADSEDMSLHRASLYLMLADAKNIGDSGEMIMLALRDEDEQAASNNGTLYEAVGLNRGYMTNEFFYFDRAIEILENLFWESHPQVVWARYHRNTRRLSNFAFDEDIYKETNECISFLCAYYPTFSLERLGLMVAGAMCDVMGQKPMRPFFFDRTIEAMEVTYGKTSPEFFDSAQLPIFLYAVDSHLGKTYLDKYDNLLAEGGISERPMVAEMYYLNLLLMLHNFMPEQVREDIDNQLDYYCENADGSLASLAVGNALSNHYFLSRYDMKRASQAKETHTADVTVHYGEDSPQYYYVMTERAAAQDNPEKYMLGLKKELANKTVNRMDFLLRNIDLKLAEHYLVTKNDYKSSVKTLQGVLRAYNLTPMQKFDVTGNLIRSMVAGSWPPTEIEPYLQEVKALSREVEPLYANPYVFINTAQCLYGQGRFEEAIEMAEAGMEAHTAQTGSAFDAIYLGLNNVLADCYTFSGNRAKASEITTRDIEQISQGAMLMPSPELFDYLMNRFTFAVEDQNLAHIAHITPVMMSIFQYLMNNSDNRDQIMYTLGLQFFSKVMQMSCGWYNQMKNSDWMLRHANAAEATKRIMENAVTQANQILPTLKNIEVGFPEYSKGYKSLYEYWLLNFTFATLYQSIIPDNEQAELYLLKCLTFEGNPAVSRDSHLNIADFYQSQEQWEKAEWHREQAERIIRKHFTGMFNLEMMADNIAFARAYTHQRWNEMLPIARRSLARMKKEIGSNFQFMSTADQEGFLNRWGDPAGPLNGILEEMPEIAGEAYDATVYRTGLQLRSQQATQRAIERSTDPAVRQLADSLAMMKTQRKGVFIPNEKYGTPEADELTRQITAIDLRITRAEQDLIALTVAATDTAEVSWRQIRDALRPGQAAVEYVFSHRHIMALVLTPGCEAPEAVRLAATDSLTTALQRLGTRSSATMARKLYHEQAVDLYSMLWQPLEGALNGAREVYFSAPGVLHGLSFNAIAAPDGTTLFDRYDLHQLTTTAELLTPDDGAVPKSAIVVGDILFDPAQRAEADAPDKTAGARGFDLDEDYALDDFDERGLKRSDYHFRYLTYTSGEIDRISEVFGESNVRITRRAGATEGALRGLATKPSEVLHLATHGFFIANESDAVRVPFMQRYMGAVGSSMQRAGIALAGAEQTWCGAELPEADDGIMTANEVSALDLSGTRLAVLSACETALGNYSFEGVFGLPRGFKQAGVKSLLVSLWSVNDRSTSEFMTEFYTRWLGGTPRHQAYREAIAAVRANHPAPHAWAPFIMLD